MSYDIFYRRLMIEVPVEGMDTVYLPLVEHGDSNVWYSGNGGRARNWKRLVSFGGENALLTEEAVMNVIRSWRTSEAEEHTDYENRFFSYFSGLSLYNRGKNTTSWASFRNFFQSGFREALTVEELHALFGKKVIGTVDKNDSVEFVSTSELIEFSDSNWSREDLFKVKFNVSVDKHSYRLIRQHFKDHENSADRLFKRAASGRR